MIDYKIIQKSIDFFEEKGFSRIEVPWLVTESVDSITRPEGVEPYVVQSKNKNLIASGEQGFLYLYLKEYLTMGKFQTTTPCFRNDVFDLTHTKYFIKNELIQTIDVNQSNLELMVDNSKKFFQSLFNHPVEIEKTVDGYDLTINGTELGSYGIRECEFLKWIYGTGCAEPRTSRLIRKYNNNGVSFN